MNRISDIHGKAAKMAEIKLIFLGTGGGRFATITQRRHTGGIRILADKLNAHLDPGPGALVYSLNAGLSPQKISALLISHSHPDHYTDAEVLIEAMTHGTTRKRGVLIAPRSVLFGNAEVEASVSKYHQGMPSRIFEAKLGEVFDVDNVKIVVTEARHSDPDTVGYRFETDDFGNFAYTSDTEYFEGIGKHYQNLRLLMLCVLRPSGNPWMGHMTTEDAIKIVEEAKPEMAVLTHFGMQMIFKGPDSEAKLVEKKTGVKTVAAKDEMRIRIAEEIMIETTRKKQPSLNKYTIEDDRHRRLES
jgi:phosphoribosyl 1,2-cyclic phosphodiesterase